MLFEIEGKFVPTIEWMGEKYDEFNKLYFGGSLGYCDFKIFKSGTGSEGNTLGLFKLNTQLYASKIDNRMYIKSFYGKEYINRSNFATLTNPWILLNGNYSATEEAWENTLIHEMCHYYTYMDGIAPSRAHGNEFYSIGKRVCALSDGKFVITRLASAEEMQNFELNDEMKQRAERRKENALSKMMIVVVERNDGIFELITTSSKKLIDEIVNVSKTRRRVEKVVVIDNKDYLRSLMERGYGSNSRTYRYYSITDSKMQEELASLSGAKIIYDAKFD